MINMNLFVFYEKVQLLNVFFILRKRKQYTTKFLNF